MQRRFEVTGGNDNGTFGYGNTSGSLPMIMDQFALDGRAGGSFTFDTTDEFSSSNLLNVVAWPEQTYPAGPGDQSSPFQIPSFSQSRKTGLLSDIFLPTAPQEFGYATPSTPMQTVPMTSYYDSTIVTTVKIEETCVVLNSTPRSSNLISVKTEETCVVPNSTPRSSNSTFSELLVRQDPRLYHQMSEMKRAYSCQMENSPSNYQSVQMVPASNNQSEKFVGHNTVSKLQKPQAESFSNSCQSKGKAVVQYSDDQHPMPTYEELMRMPNPNMFKPIEPFEYVKKKQQQSSDSVNGIPNQNKTHRSQHHVSGKGKAVQATKHNYDQIQQKPQKPLGSSLYDIKHEESELPVDPYLRAFVRNGFNDKYAARRRQKTMLKKETQ